MDKYFVPYEQALGLKELGFDEPCLGLYHNDKTFYPTQCKSHEQFHGQICSAPLYQQAFRWFREEHGLSQIIIQNTDKDWTYDILNMLVYRNYETFYVFETYEEAELECLKKLIEIVKK